jgi:hypothetical protein
MALFFTEMMMTRKVRMVWTVELLPPDVSECMKQHALLDMINAVHGMERHNLLSELTDIT